MFDRQRPKRAFLAGLLVAVGFVFVIPILFRLHVLLAALGALLAGATIGTFVRLIGRGVSFRFGIMAALLTCLSLGLSALLSYCSPMNLSTVFACAHMALTTQWIGVAVVAGLAVILAFFLGQKQVRVSDLVGERK